MTQTKRPVLSKDPKPREVSNTVNEVLRGKINSTGAFVLNAGSGSTVVKNADVDEGSVVLITADSATAAAATGLYVTVGSGQFTVHHNNTGDSDRHFRFAVLGA